MYLDTPITNHIPATELLRSVMEACSKLQNATPDQLEFIRDYLKEADDGIWNALDEIDHIPPYQP